MEIKVYKVTDDNRVVSKTLGTALGTYECVMKETTDVTAPVLRISDASNLSDVNYCYIARYGRYYYIDKIETTPTGM